MRAALLEQFGRPLRLTSLVDPCAGPGEVLIKVRAVGLCATDLKVVNGQLPATPLPIVPGHEVAGEVAADSQDFEAGQRVACYLYAPCGHCRWCAAGNDTLCPTAERIGRNVHGGLAELICVKRENALPFSDRLSFDKAAVAMDAVTSAWRAVKIRGAVGRRERVLIAGAGGLGLNAVQVAASCGARVGVLDPLPSHREAAERVGAEATASPDASAAIRTFLGDGADVGLEASGTRAGFDALVSSLSPGGRLVCCGYTPGVFYGADSDVLVRSELTVIGSRAGSREDARTALAAVEAGQIAPYVSASFALDEVNTALERLAGAQAVGRITVRPV
jgi:D-arabinose 1-dehydrogenase-like Zn-dependent alcohol dehydrogenase